MNLQNLRIKETGEEDFKNIFSVQEQAFGYEKEAILTTELLKDKTAKPCVSLLAWNEDEPVGHIDYYPRYGFTPDAGRLGFSAPYSIPPEFADAWMVQALSPDGFIAAKGRIICSDALDKPEHWRE